MVERCAQHGQTALGTSRPLIFRFTAFLCDDYTRMPATDYKGAHTHTRLSVYAFLYRDQIRTHTRARVALMIITPSSCHHTLIDAEAYTRTAHIHKHNTTHAQSRTQFSSLLRFLVCARSFNSRRYFSPLERCERTACFSTILLHLLSAHIRQIYRKIAPPYKRTNHTLLAGLFGRCCCCCCCCSFVML